MKILNVISKKKLLKLKLIGYTEKINPINIGGQIQRLMVKAMMLGKIASYNTYTIPFQFNDKLFFFCGVDADEVMKIGGMDRIFKQETPIETLSLIINRNEDEGYHNNFCTIINLDGFDIKDQLDMKNFSEEVKVELNKRGIEQRPFLTPGFEAYQCLKFNPTTGDYSIIISTDKRFQEGDVCIL